MILAIQIFIFLIALLGVGIILFTKDVVHAAYALALALLSIAGMYVLLNAEMLAIVQILIYAGGVVVLLVFGVMMTNRMGSEKPVSKSSNVVLGALISFGIFSLLIYFISRFSFQSIRDLPNRKNQVREIGISFLTDHIVAFELIAFILLVALVGAAYLAKISSNE